MGGRVAGRGLEVIVDDVALFPFAEYWWFYGVFILFVLGMLALDLGVFHRKSHAVTFKLKLRSPIHREAPPGRALLDCQEIRCSQ